MLPIAPMISSSIPSAIIWAPGLAPLLVMLAFLLWGAVEILRGALAQRRTRSSVPPARPLMAIPKRPATQRPLTA